LVWLSLTPPFSRCERGSRALVRSRRLERQSLLGAREAHALGAQHGVHVGERLAEGECHLMRIVDSAAEDDRHEIGHRLRLDLASFEDGEAARLVMGDELIGRMRRPTNGRLWPGSTRTSSGSRSLSFSSERR
jgi:hypothetical protein